MGIETMKAITSFVLFASMVVVRQGAGIEQAILASILIFSISFFGDFLTVIKLNPAFSDQPTFLSKALGLIGCTASGIMCLLTFMSMIGALEFRIINLDSYPVFYLLQAEGSMIRIPQLEITWVLFFYYLLPAFLHTLMLIRALCLSQRKKKFTLEGGLVTK